MCSSVVLDDRACPACNTTSQKPRPASLKQQLHTHARISCICLDCALQAFPSFTVVKGGGFLNAQGPSAPVTAEPHMRSHHAQLDNFTRCTYGKMHAWLAQGIICHVQAHSCLVCHVQAPSCILLRSWRKQPLPSPIRGVHSCPACSTLATSTALHPAYCLSPVAKNFK